MGSWDVYATVLGCDPVSLGMPLATAVANTPKGNEGRLDAALRRTAARARADYRAGRISLAECRQVTRAVRETLGGE